jgi:hypothetical protein
VVDTLSEAPSGLLQTVKLVRHGEKETSPLRGENAFMTLIPFPCVVGSLGRDTTKSGSYACHSPPVDRPCAAGMPPHG